MKCFNTAIDYGITPKKVKDRSYIRQLCSEKFGRPFEEVEKAIAVRKQLFE